MNWMFRGKRISNKKWVYGYIWIIPVVNLNYILTVKIDIRDCSIEKYEVDPSTVGIGVEIKGKWYFEGDHVKCLDYNDEWYETTIMWDGNAMIIDVKNRDYDYTTLLWALKEDIQEIEIIGTKWDNPELVEVGK
jgi:hypothetical protein